MPDATQTLRPRGDDATIRRALGILEKRMRQTGVQLASPRAVRDYLRLRFAEMQRECFVVLYLDTQNRLLECVVPFYGTLTQTSVHPREIVKLALSYNAAAAILAHNLSLIHI